MSRNLSLTAYRALSRRKGQSASVPYALRPPGELVWAHATSETRMSALCDLGARLKSQRPGLSLLLTTDPELFNPSKRLPDGANWIYPLVSDHPDSVAQFLAHWQPDAGLWTGGHLLPNLICAASVQNIPLILLDAGADDFQSRQHRWFRELTRTSLLCFRSITTNGSAAAKLILSYGIPDKNVTISTRLSDGAAPTPCDEQALAVVTQSLAGQPVWLAAYVQASEIDAIIKAHRNAIRFSHRLLLVMILSDTGDYAQLESALSISGLRYCDWQPGYVIEDNIQVAIARAPDDLGLWFRAAPLTFMASSLTPGSKGRGPFEAAALGSAILYGPYVSDHLPAYSRLAAAGAARTVRDADGLGSAVVQMIAPDHSATMALAGWEIVTESAHLTDKLVDQVQDILDLREAKNARS